jgi:HSP20 family protein
MMTMYVSPNRRLMSLREAMNRMFEETYPEFQSSERESLLAVNVMVEDDAFTVKALVPGLKADDLSIEILNNTVAIRGEFPAEQVESARYLASELPSGRFARVINLPVDVEAGKVEASIKDGVLNLRIPKAEAHRPKTIKISTN